MPEATETNQSVVHSRNPSSPFLRGMHYLHEHEDEDEDEQDGLLLSDNVPNIPARIISAHQKYRSSRSALFKCWRGRSIIILTRFTNKQLHKVDHPGGYRKQLTFFQDPVMDCTKPSGMISPYLYLLIDSEGSERYQIVRIRLDRPNDFELLTDGESRNSIPVFTPDGAYFAYYTTKRTGIHYDIVMASAEDPTNIKTILQAPDIPELVGGIWHPLEFSKDAKFLLVQFYRTVIQSRLFLLALDGSGTLHPVGEVGDPNTYSVGIGKFSKDCRGIYYVSEFGEDFKTLRYYDIKTKEVIHITSPSVDRPSVLQGDPISWDITEIAVSPRGTSLAFLANEDGYSQLYICSIHRADGDLTFKYQAKEMVKPGIISNLKYDDSGHMLAFTYETPSSPADVYTYNEMTRIVQQWTFSENGGLKKDLLITPALVRCPSHDGLFQIPVFYYQPLLPPVISASAKEKKQKKFPVVIYLHGGPAKQFAPTFEPHHNAISFQLICEMGVAVLAPNVRGSTGYGRTYTMADDGMKREGSIEDVGSILRWVAEQPELDSSRVAVMGRSYGGFLTLSSMIRFSDKISCGIQTCGITDFLNFLKNTAPYRVDLRRPEYGDERIPEVAEFLHKISPMSTASKLTQPILMAHGINDSRVPFSEFQRLVEKLRKYRDRDTSDPDKPDSADIWTLAASGEGHVFENTETLCVHAQLMALFLERYLIGHKSNLGKDVFRDISKHRQQKQRASIPWVDVVNSAKRKTSRVSNSTSIDENTSASYEKPPSYFHALRPFSLGKQKQYTVTTAIIIEEAEKLNIKVEKVSANFGIIRMTFGNDTHYLRQSMLPTTSGVSMWMADQKSASYDLLAFNGFPVPKSVMIPITRGDSPDDINIHNLQAKLGDLTGKTPEELKQLNQKLKLCDISHEERNRNHDILVRSMIEKASKAADTVGFPCVVKPEAESGGRGVTCNINTHEELVDAVQLALFHAVNSPGLIVQEHVYGNDYRILVVDYKLIAAAKRVPACVYGDGVHSILKLIDLENSNPLRSEGHTSPLTKISVDVEVIKVLLSQGMTLDSVPAVGQTVMLRDKANLSTGGHAIDVTEQIPENNINLIERLCIAVEMAVCGVDIRCNSITEEFNEQTNPFKVIELNASPGLRMHHYPSKGVSRNVASKLLRLLFPEAYEKKKRRDKKHRMLESEIAQCEPITISNNPAQ